MPVSQPILGTNTATPRNLAYRVGRIAPYLSGRWLDYGCAEGGYAEALLSHGASSVVGVDVDEGRIIQATARGIPNATFQVFNGYELESKDNSFDGAFVNEVLEYVADEQASLRDIYRVLRPSGCLVLISPNRWFPFEGHGAKIMNVELSFPTPFIPWLPGRFTRNWLHTRNYWPHQLVTQVQNAGFIIHEIGFIWPVFDTFRWLPLPVVSAYRRWMGRLDRTPGVRRFGLSTLVIATKPSEPCMDAE
jgi:ubiquinone/menaquinone biosynthesis C-methylase UbiE